MRLWHQKLISSLPARQLLGQHRECCALRGNGWGKKHSVVDYVFSHPMEELVAYHMLIIQEMERRGYHVEPFWKTSKYRGKQCKPMSFFDDKIFNAALQKLTVYREHDSAYLLECLENLQKKGIIIERNSQEGNQL